ncbi:MAG TPA: AAA family ATPase [Candidatus Norongarragalinales archaeon]|jgi:chromosome segregation protein|nr:AAA family ATPase [Candidatus Norongarragalinales archaeon]
MHVSKIQLKNFKSFKNATVEFQPGLNAVIGPNGSGKSNIVDALMFCFGENRLKNMRVRKTPDLIFSNSSIADAAVVFENKDGTTTTVGRAVRRDGKTRYTLNNKIQKKYVIDEYLASNHVSLEHAIKQGEVQQIVEMNSKDRRTLIDAVANVSEYETKKREALSELDKVDDRLKEAATVLAEREGYLKELEQEKKDAEKHISLKQRVDQLKVTLLSIDARNIEKEFDNVVKELLDTSEKTQNIQNDIKALETKIESFQKEKDAVNQEIIARGQGREVELQREIDELNAQISLSQALIADRKQQLEKSDSRLKEITLEYTRVFDEVKGAQQRIHEVNEELASLNKILGETQGDYDAMLKKSEQFSAQFYNARAQYETAQNDILKLKEELNALQAQTVQHQEVKKLKENELQRLLQGAFEDFEKKEKETTEQRGEAQKAIKAAQRELDEMFREEKELNEKIPVVEDLLLLAKEKIAEISSRLRTAKEFEGGGPIEAVLEWGKKSKGVHGTLAQLGTYESKYSLPVQVALGARTNWVVVETSDTASQAIDFLKKQRLGRVSFVPLDKANSPPISAGDREIAKREGVIGFLYELMDFEPKHEKAFRLACGNTLVVKDLAHAKPILGKIRLVTLEGELGESGGLLVGGTFREKINALKERTDLEMFNKKAESARAEKEAIITQLRSLREEMTPVRKSVAEAELKVKTLDLEIEHLRGAQERELAKKANIKTAADALKKEVKQAEKELSQVDEARSDLIRKLSELNIDMLQLKEAIDVEKEKNFGLTVKEKERKIMDLKIQISDYSNQLQSLEKSKAVYDKQAQGLKKDKDSIESEWQEVQNAFKEHDAIIKKARGALKEKTEEQKQLSSRVKDLIEKRENLEKLVQKTAQDKGRLEFEREKTERGSQDKQIKKAILETKLSNLKAELMAFQNVEPIHNKTAEDKPELDAEIKRSQQELDALGGVNLRAIELFETKRSEYTLQIERVKQLQNEKAAVLTLITEIEGKKIGSFMQTFDHVNANFQRLFSQIFKGRGSLFLEDKVNPFNGGLTIEVQLENKEVKYLELMSGGEKSLIALMFLFAMQSFNPSSVYILDEADAALDQENSQKLADLLRELSKDSQFIVVTHNETLFRAVDCLVGVAMSKEGSKLVEVKMAQ